MLTATKDDNLSKNVSSNFRSAANESIDDAKDTLRDGANKAGRKVRNLFNTANDEITHAREVVTSQIRTNPVQSSLIALGAGFVLGALFRR